MYYLHFWCWGVNQAWSRQRGEFITSFSEMCKYFPTHLVFKNFLPLFKPQGEKLHTFNEYNNNILFSLCLSLWESKVYLTSVKDTRVFLLVCPHYIRDSAVCFDICSNEIICAYTKLASFHFFFRNWRHSAWMSINLQNIIFYKYLTFLFTLHCACL
jgi:hypothetical protein